VPLSRLLLKSLGCIKEIKASSVIPAKSHWQLIDEEKKHWIYHYKAAMLVMLLSCAGIVPVNWLISSRLKNARNQNNAIIIIIISYQLSCRKSPRLHEQVKLSLQIEQVCECADL
jgi:hypothetical protein